jgi:hypothetical protein
MGVNVEARKYRIPRKKALELHFEIENALSNLLRLPELALGFRPQGIGSKFT